MLLAVLLSWRLALIVVLMTFRTPLPLVMSPSVMMLWLAVVIVTSAVASGYPVWQASRRTVREALAYM